MRLSSADSDSTRRELLSNIVIKWNYFTDKKYRRALDNQMNIRPKNNSKRKDSHSREHHSNLRSQSRSTDKNKQRSNSKFIKFKTA